MIPVIDFWLKENWTVNGKSFKLKIKCKLNFAFIVGELLIKFLLKWKNRTISILNCYREMGIEIYII